MLTLHSTLDVILSTVVKTFVYLYIFYDKIGTLSCQIKMYL